MQNNSIMMAQSTAGNMQMTSLEAAKRYEPLQRSTLGAVKYHQHIATAGQELNNFLYNQSINMPVGSILSHQGPLNVTPKNVSPIINKSST